MKQNFTLAHGRALFIAALIEKGDSSLIPNWAPPEIRDLKAARSLTIDQIYNFVVRDIQGNELITQNMAIGAKKSTDEMTAMMSKLLA